MVSHWMILAPWWARWLVNAAGTALLLTALAALFFPEFPTTTAWPWKVVAMVSAGLALSAALVYAQQPLRDCYATRLRGLTRQQQNSAIAAVRHGGDPADPAVLSAAIRVGAVSMTSLRRGSKQQRTSQWLLPLLYLVLGTWSLVDSDVRKGLLWIGFSLYFATYLTVWSRRTRGIPDHVASLRAAAAHVPEAAGVLPETAGGALLPPRWQWQSLPLVVVTVAYFVTAGYFWGAPTLSHFRAHRQDCEKVPQVYEFVTRHPEMLDAAHLIGRPSERMARGATAQTRNRTAPRRRRRIITAEPNARYDHRQQASGSSRPRRERCTKTVICCVEIGRHGSAVVRGTSSADP